MSAHGAGSPATGSLSNKRGMCPKACQPSVQATLRLPTTGGGGGPAAAGPFFLDSSASLFTSTSFSYLQHVQQSVQVGDGGSMLRCKCCTLVHWRCSSTESAIGNLSCAVQNLQAAF